MKTTTFGAFVNLVPGRDGLVHISKLGKGKRLSSVEDAVKEGDTLEVEVQDIDAQGKISLKPVGRGVGGAGGQRGHVRRRPPRAAIAASAVAPRDRERSGGGGGGGDRGARRRQALPRPRTSPS